MKMKIEEIAILSSQTGDGLRIGNKTIGCAKITKLKLEDGKTLTDYAKEGLNLDYLLMQQDDGTPRVVFTDDLRDGNNYVLFIRDEESGATSVVLSTLDITNLFELPKEDADQMDKYLSALANQRQLNMIRYTELGTEKDAIFFTNQFDREINEMLLDTETSDGEVLQTYNSMITNPEFRTELTTDNFIKIFLMSVVRSGQDRYNKLYRDDVLKEIAEKLSNITYWSDGTLYNPSVKDINNMLTDITGCIRIK
jgi:hypothetical protein